MELVVTGMALLLVLTSTLAFIFYRTRKRLLHDVMELKKTNDELEKVKIELVNKYRQQLVINNLGVIEDERRKIGADLHDFMGSMLWAAKVQLGLASRRGNPNDEGINALNKATEIIDETMQNTRLVIQRLVPKTLITVGLSEAIQEHCERISTDAMQFDFSEQGEPFFKGSNDHKLVLLFRIVQELLNNCVKYSDASVIHVNLNWGAQLIIALVNNGKPFQMKDSTIDTSNGLGTHTVLERINLLNGKLTSEAGPPNTFILEIPYK